jgi:hypothetical protein
VDKSRGHEADGTMFPGGGLRALQELLGYVDELRAELEKAPAPRSGAGLGEEEQKLARSKGREE